MKKILFFLLLSFVVKVSYAQSDTAKSAPHGLIQYSRPGFFRNGKFSVDGQQETFKEITYRLANDKASAYEYNQFRKYNHLTAYMGGAAIACLISSLIVNDNNNGWKNTPAKVLVGAGFGFIIPEFIFAGKRNKHFWRSVNLYNHYN